MPAVNYTHSEGVARITLNNPPQNRLTNDLIAGLGAAIQDLAGRSDTRVLLLNAEGPNFSYGGDITTWLDSTEESFSESIKAGLGLTGAFQSLPFPVIVAVQGYCGGGGFEIALRGDVIVAADDAKFCHSEASISAFTFLGGVQRVAERVGRTRALQWALTAEQVGAQDALHAGLINEVVPLSELSNAAERWLDRFKDSATLSHAAHKTLLRAWSDGGVAAADALMPSMAGKILMSADSQGCLPDAIEAVKAGASRPQFTFHGK
ncbi:MAG: enoyl-CoA hydratase-related protein [Pseudomonadota bacterium]